MNWVSAFFIENFVLICISVAMYILAIQRFKQHRRISVYTISLISSALLLAVMGFVEIYAKTNGIKYLAIVTSIIGYSLRPACVCFMILMNEKIIPSKYLWILFVPLVVNFIVYACALIPGADQFIFGFIVNDDNTLSFMGGGPLRFTSHVISAMYLGLLFFVAIANLKLKHLDHSLILLVGVLFVVTAVVIESFFNDNGDIRLLNVTIAVSTLLYYLFLYMERSQIDGLTGLFNRETFYHDKHKMEDSVIGVIQFDMDGLKYINDNLGHHEGDKALKTIASVINSSIKRNMYAYRLGGDEFIVLVNGGKEEDIKEVIKTFKEELGKTSYHCSVGFSYRENGEIGLKDLIKESEKAMYANKTEFYKNSNFERRKS